jgi:hypothetical protein
MKLVAAPGRGCTLKGSLPQVALSGGKEKLLRPSEWRYSIGQCLGCKSILCDIHANAIQDVGESGVLEENLNSIYVIEVIIGKIR